MTKSSDALTQRLYQHYAEMHRVYYSVPQWMTEYAVCPEHWYRLCQESVMRTHMMDEQSTGRCIHILGFTLHLLPDAVLVPPLCVFHSLGV